MGDNRDEENLILEGFESCELNETTRYPCPRCNNKTNAESQQPFRLVRPETTLEELVEADVVFEVNANLYSNVATADMDTPAKVFQCQDCRQLLVYFPSPCRELHVPDPEYE